MAIRVLKMSERVKIRDGLQFLAWEGDRMGGHALIGLDNRKVIFMEEGSTAFWIY